MSDAEAMSDVEGPPRKSRINSITTRPIAFLGMCGWCGSDSGASRYTTPFAICFPICNTS